MNIEELGGICQGTFSRDLHADFPNLTHDESVEAKRLQAIERDSVEARLKVNYGPRFLFHDLVS
jgi:hypothetical protein